ncbi:hypothetical protein BH11VER1_BH11VER1_24910 [soil metagenome]
MLHPSQWFALILIPFFAVTQAWAHPLPDIPVRAAFEEKGACQIQVEIDPRCFEADPNKALSLWYSELQKLPEAGQLALKTKAQAYLLHAAAFSFEPMGRLVPEFVFEFTTHGGKPLTEPADIVVITGTWRPTIPAGIQGYRLHALPEGTMSVLFLNKLKGQEVERMQVLFPGESSYLLDLTGFNASTPLSPLAGAVGQRSGAGGWWSTFGNFMRQGFLHVLPFGLDHILFVLGLFLLSREWRPLLLQVTTFTVAHTLTLGLATLGWVNVSPSVVEPIIAGSIAVVALENIFRPYYTSWRLLLVFTFGLVHGLGFAGALRQLELPTASLLVGLLGFNVGVEGGQLAVIAMAVAVTFWIKKPVLYRKFIVIPGSLIIAALGLKWMIERLS